MLFRAEEPVLIVVDAQGTPASHDSGRLPCNAAILLRAALGLSRWCGRKSRASNRPNKGLSDHRSAIIRHRHSRFHGNDDGNGRLLVFDIRS